MLYYNTSSPDIILKDFEYISVLYNLIVLYEKVRLFNLKLFNMLKINSNFKIYYYNVKNVTEQ